MPRESEPKEEVADAVFRESKGEVQEPVGVAKINFPSFDEEDIETWFLCLEASFCVNLINSDRQKYNAVVVALGSRAKHFHGAIAKCNTSEASDRYNHMRKTVIDYYQPSENERLTSLLSGVSLGDRKPSALLREMRRMGGEGCSDAVFSNLWLRALPTTVRSILAAMPSSTLEDQARVADKILEAPRNEVASIEKQESNYSRLEQRIEELAEKLDTILSIDRDSRQSRFASHQQTHARPTRDRKWSVNRRSATPSRSSHDAPRWICWFHYRYGAQAQKCEKEKTGDSKTQCIFFEEHLPVHKRNK